MHGKAKGPSEGSALGQCWEEVGRPGNLLVEVGVARKSRPCFWDPVKMKERDFNKYLVLNSL